MMELQAIPILIYLAPVRLVAPDTPRVSPTQQQVSLFTLQTRDRADNSPITIISVFCGVEMLHRNREEFAHWRELRDEVS